MKKILSWCGSHIELLCAFFLLGCCINSAVKDGWSSAILFLPFIIMWISAYRLQKYIRRLIKKNEELKETNKQLEKDYKRIKDLKSLTYYKYLLAQNDVDLCKKKISCGDYLSSRRYYEERIDSYRRILKERGQSV